MTNHVTDKRRPSRGERITVRFDAVEAERVGAFASAMGVGPSTFGRAAILDAVEGGGASRVERIREHSSRDESGSADKEELRRLRTEVNRVGVLFNQTVRKVNTDGAAVLNDEKVLEEIIAVGKVLRDVQEQMGGTRWPS